MKKTFSFNTPNKKRDRQVEATIHQINKYMKRERRKTLPEKADFWGFDCKIGENEKIVSAIHEKEISKKILELASQDIESFYIEILVKPETRHKKSKTKDLSDHDESE